MTEKKLLVSEKIATDYIYCTQCGKIVFQRNEKGIVMQEDCDCKKEVKK